MAGINEPISFQFSLLNTKTINPRLTRILSVRINFFLNFGFTDGNFSDFVRTHSLGFEISPHLQIYDNSSRKKLNTDKQQHNSQNQKRAISNVFSQSKLHNH